MLVSHGTHDGADGQAVEVVVDEDDTAQDGSGNHSADAGLDVGLSPAAVSSGAAGLVDQADHHAQDNQEDQDTDVPGVGQLDDHDVEGVGDHTPDVEVGVQQSTGQDADEQGGVDLLGDQGQADGDDGGQQGPDGGVGADGLTDGSDGGGNVVGEVLVGSNVVGVAVQVLQSHIGIAHFCSADAHSQGGEQGHSQSQQEQGLEGSFHVADSFLYLILSNKKPRTQKVHIHGSQADE